MFFLGLRIVVILLSLSSVEISFSKTITLVCNNSTVTFEFQNDNDSRCLCPTINSALEFLESIGLEINDSITIRLVDHINSSIDNNLVGSYNLLTHEVCVLTYDKTSDVVKTNKAVLGVPMTEELWCSYAAHEFAHVVSSRYLSPHIKTHTAGEYVAAVTQLSVISPDTREKILARYSDIDAYQSRAEMSELYFLMDPNKFAVKCYKHFLSLKDPRTFIEELVREGTKN